MKKSLGARRIRAIEAIEEAAVSLLRVSEAYSQACNAERPNLYNIAQSRQQLFYAARVYANAVRRLANVK